MQQPSHPYHQESHDAFVWFIIIIGLVLLGWVLKAKIIYGVCYLLYRLYKALENSHFHRWFAHRINILALTGNHAHSVSYGQFVEVMNYTAGILFPILAIICVVGIVVTVFHPRNKTRRKISIDNLPLILAKISPSIIPSLCYGDKKTQLLNVDPPEHAPALTPDEWVKKQALIFDDDLDKEKAILLFKRQLGRKYQKIDQLNAHEKALFTLFALQHFCNNRKRAETLLDELNRSCLIKSKRDNNQLGYPILSIVNKDFALVIKNKDVQAFVTRHHYVRTLIYGLYDNDLRLPTSRFRWLKGLDRPLWYALSSAGRPKPFIEAAGIVLASQAEQLAHQLNVSITHYPWNNLLLGLEDYLLKLNLIKAPLDIKKTVDLTDDSDQD